MASSGTRYFCLQRSHLTLWVCEVTWKQPGAFKSAPEVAGSSSLPRVLGSRQGGQVCLLSTVPMCWDSLWGPMGTTGGVLILRSSASLHSPRPSLDPYPVPLPQPSVSLWPGAPLSSPWDHCKLCSFVPLQVAWCEPLTVSAALASCILCSYCLVISEE